MLEPIQQNVSISDTLIQILAFLDPVLLSATTSPTKRSDKLVSSTPIKGERPVPHTPVRNGEGVSPNKAFRKDSMTGYSPQLWNTLNNTVNLGHEDIPINNENKCPSLHFALSTLSPNRPIQKQDQMCATNNRTIGSSSSSLEHMMLNELLASNDKKVMKSFCL
jgi:hypothetical protein